LTTGRRRSRPGFTLIEILVVLAIIATLAAIVLPQLFKSGETGEAAETRVRLDSLANAAKLYESRFGDYPPSRLKFLKIDAPNDTNEGSEAFVLAISTEKKRGPFTEWQEDYLGNCDGDKLKKPPEKSAIKKADLFEAVDFWGNPFVYIHCRDYGKQFKYVDYDGDTVSVRAQKSKKLGTYHNANSYQMWSFGPNRRNENGSGDDIANFTISEEEGEAEGDEGPP